MKKECFRKILCIGVTGILGMFSLGRQVFAEGNTLADSGHQFLLIGLEPYVGYSFLGELSDSGSGSSSNQPQPTYNGPTFGSRATVLFDGTYFAGLDVSLGLLSGTVSNYSPSGTLVNLGAIAGIRMHQIPLRFWVGVNFARKLNYTFSVSDTSTIFSTVYSGLQNAQGQFGYYGLSFKGGVGYNIWKDIAINAEGLFSTYSSLSFLGAVFTGFDDSTTGSSSNLLNSGSIDLSSFDLLVSVSVPLILKI
jgi:hypothetical protein